jgi:CRISPR-associated protein Cmr6
LWLDRFVAGLGEKAAAARHLESALEALRVAEEYPDFFQRFTAALARLPPRTLLADASASGRLVAGLGADSVLETSIALHRTWGVPYLPGSALKGLAARAARQRLDPPWEPSSEPYQILFGELESAGHVTFHDALWCPFEKKTGAPKTALPLDLDVMTVHHAAYYAGEQVPPTDWDDPNPVPFLTTRDTFRLALTGPPGWVELAFKILQGALEQDGLGAKTAAGYGRMRVAELGEMSVAEAVPRPV